MFGGAEGRPNPRQLELQRRIARVTLLNAVVTALTLRASESACPFHALFESASYMSYREHLGIFFSARHDTRLILFYCSAFHLGCLCQRLSSFQGLI